VVVEVEATAMATTTEERTAVSIERSTLFVGGTAYPLQGIVRVQSIEFVLDRGRVIGSFVRSLWIPFIPLVVAICAASNNAGFPALVWVAIAAGIVALQVRSLRRRLNRPPVYALTVQNAAGTQNLLYSGNGQQMAMLVSNIIDAIDDRSKTLAQIFVDRSTNVNMRDYLNVSGSQNTVTTGH
jgi:hypothetical protein